MPRIDELLADLGARFGILAESNIVQPAQGATLGGVGGDDGSHAGTRTPCSTLMGWISVQTLPHQETFGLIIGAIEIAVRMFAAEDRVFPKPFKAVKSWAT